MDLALRKLHSLTEVKTQEFILWWKRVVTIGQAVNGVLRKGKFAIGSWLFENRINRWLVVTKFVRETSISSQDTNNKQQPCQPLSLVDSITREMVFTQTEDNYSSSDTMSHVGKHDEERADVVEVVPQSYGQHLANPVRWEHLPQ